MTDARQTSRRPPPKRRKFDAKLDLDPSQALDYLSSPIPNEPVANFDDLEWSSNVSLFDKLDPNRQAEVMEAWEDFLRQRRESGRQAGRDQASNHPVSAAKERAKQKVRERRGMDPSKRNQSKQKRVRLISQREAEERWIEMARKSPIHFYRYVFGLKPQKFHIEWMRQFLDPEHLKTLVVAPRGSAKTTVSLIMLSWIIGHYPELNHQIISVSLKQAMDRLRFIKSTIEHNPRFKKVFPYLSLDKKLPNNATTLSIKRNDMNYGAWRARVTRMADGKSPTLYCSGVGGQGVVGSRVTGVLIMDDVCDAKNMRTEDLREELWNWIVTTLIPVMTLPHADYARLFPRVFHVTTRWHAEDVAQRQIDSGEYTYSTTRVLKWIDGKLASYWPGQFPLKRLLKLRKELGAPAFGLMFLNSIGALEGDIFHIDMLRQDLPDALPPMRYVFITVDPALTAKEGSDDSVVSTILVDFFWNFYLVDMQYGKWRDQTTVANINRAWTRAHTKYCTGEEPLCSRLPYVLLESTGAQALFGTLVKNAGVVPVKHVLPFKPSMDKAVRARALAALADRGGFFLKLSSKWYPKFMSQCLEFTGEPGGTDDMVDSVSMLAQHLQGAWSSRPRQANTKTYKPPAGLAT